MSDSCFELILSNKNNNFYVGENLTIVKFKYFSLPSMKDYVVEIGFGGIDKYFIVKDGFLMTNPEIIMKESTDVYVSVKILYEDMTSAYITCDWKLLVLVEETKYMDEDKAREKIIYGTMDFNANDN